MLNKEIKKLTVKYNNRIVGYIAELENNIIAFQYDEEWIKNGFSISPFSLPLSNKIYQNGSSIFNSLYGVFYDSLPDGWGLLLVIRMLAKIGINFNKLSPLIQLSIIQKNGLGALEYIPHQNIDNTNINKYILDELAIKINKILENKNSNSDLDKLYQYGGSSGGARPKAHLRINNEEWIIKFPSSSDPQDAGKKEYETNMLAKQCGININECKLFPSKICAGYFGAKRFDRNKGKRIHVISLAALLETSHRYFNLDYSHLFNVIKAISVNKLNDMYEAFRRMTFNVFIKNKDDHSKNFAFIYDELKHGYVLSPAYDLTANNVNLEHSMTINGKGNPNENNLLDIAKNFDLSIKKCKEIIDNIKQICNHK